MANQDVKKLAEAALDAIKPRWRGLAVNIKDRLLADVSAALTAVSEPEAVEVDEDNEV